MSRATEKAADNGIVQRWMANGGDGELETLVADGVVIHAVLIAKPIVSISGRNALTLTFVPVAMIHRCAMISV